VGVGAPGTKYDWNLTGIPQPALKNRSIATPAGKVIGGGTILNGMVYNRGSKSDYDRWEHLGNPGWNFDGLLPHFKKVETFTPPGAELSEWDIEYDPAFHGNHGFLQSSFSRFVWPSTRKIFVTLR
jgi:choline dehydrogenase-like flavoprotein